MLRRIRSLLLVLLLALAGAFIGRVAAEVRRRQEEGEDPADIDLRAIRIRPADMVPGLVAAVRVHDQPWSWLHIPSWLAAFAVNLAVAAVGGDLTRLREMGERAAFNLTGVNFAEEPEPRAATYTTYGDTAFRGSPFRGSPFQGAPAPATPSETAPPPAAEPTAAEPPAETLDAVVDPLEAVAADPAAPSETVEAGEEHAHAAAEATSGLVAEAEAEELNAALEAAEAEADAEAAMEDTAEEATQAEAEDTDDERSGSAPPADRGPQRPPRPTSGFTPFRD